MTTISLNPNMYKWLCLEIHYSDLNFNDAAVKVWEWINKFIPQFTEHVILILVVI